LCTAPGVAVVTATTNLGTHLGEQFPLLLARVLLVHDALDFLGIGVNQKLGTTEAHTPEEFLDNVEELDVEHGFGENDVTKMSWAKSVFLMTRLAEFVVIQDAHTWIEQSVHDRLIELKGVGVGDFSHRHTFDFIGTEYTKTNTFNGLYVVVVGEFLVNRHLFNTRNLLRFV